VTVRAPGRAGEFANAPDPVRVYLREVGRVALLDAAQEVDLAKRIEAGVFAAERLRQAAVAGQVLDRRLGRDLRLIVGDGGRARNHLLEANLRLVVSLAKRYTGRGMPFLDLVQEGNLGLIRAVEKFDYVQGYKFSTYATWWIRQALSRALSDQSRTIRIPVHVGELITRLARTRRALLQELGRDATQAELAVAMDVTPERVTELQRYGREPVSLDEPLGEEGDTRLGDLVEDATAAVGFDALNVAFMQAELQNVLATLSDRESGVIRLRFGLADGRPHTLDEISRVYGVTRERIRQIEAKTMTKLRHPARSQALRGYVD
jgi:RNA polymerase primary sigma factor